MTTATDTSALHVTTPGSTATAASTMATPTPTGTTPDTDPHDANTESDDDEENDGTADPVRSVAATPRGALSASAGVAGAMDVEATITSDNDSCNTPSGQPGDDPGDSDDEEPEDPSDDSSSGSSAPRTLRTPRSGNSKWKRKPLKVTIMVTIKSISIDKFNGEKHDGIDSGAQSW